jgi:hypothetical protein
LNLESLKEAALKCEELKYSNTRGEQIYCILVLSSKDYTKETLKHQLPKNGTIESKRFGSLPLNFLDISEVTRVSITRKRTYRTMRKKLTEPFPDLVNGAKLRLKKALSGELSGVSIDLLKSKLEQKKQDTIQRIALLAADKLPKKEKETFLKQLKVSKECLITNYLTADTNLWLTIQSASGSKHQRAKRGVTVVLSSEDHTRKDGEVAKLVTEAVKNGWVAGQIVLIK